MLCHFCLTPLLGCLCAAFVGSAVITSTSGGSADAGGAAAALLNPLCVLGALGLGVSLVQIHIYVDPLKKALQVRCLWICRAGGPCRVAVTIAVRWIWQCGPRSHAAPALSQLCVGTPSLLLLSLLRASRCLCGGGNHHSCCHRHPACAVLVPQVLWLAGVLGAVYVASQQPDQPLPLLIAQQPWTVWFVGPAAAAVTGALVISCGAGTACHDTPHTECRGGNSSALCGVRQTVNHLPTQRFWLCPVCVSSLPAGGLVPQEWRSKKVGSIGLPC